ncbi:MAG: L-2-hydroxyglutarate oxidase [Candidatus Omnitrophica bacterium]|nr:L-2-hydroxyglutarate oxidase [Candidatus Omnitrophota bacterium]
MFDIVVIGGGIIGLATAREILQRSPTTKLLLLEKEPQLATHQTGHNSGVIHSGVYYRPGSLKARLGVEGARRMRQFCEEHGIPSQRVGKVIVAVEERELSALKTLEERGVANGVPDLTRIGPERLRELEPHAYGIAALHLPYVAIVDFTRVAQAMAEDIRRRGGTIRTGARVTRLAHTNGTWRIETTGGDVEGTFLINCGGLHSDRLGRMAGDQPSVRIIPFRGEYFTIRSERASLVNGLIYPVPNPALPFLGVHFTKMLDGGVHVGPNAVLALKREGYRRGDVSLRECVELLCDARFWKMSARFWRVGCSELARSLNPQAFLQAAQRLVPELRSDDLTPSPAGVRAQAVDGQGALCDDFAIERSRDGLHVYNAPSPAATAALTIAETLAASLPDGRAAAQSSSRA